jgi:hypothetical protein
MTKPGQCFTVLVPLSYFIVFAGQNLLLASLNASILVLLNVMQLQVVSSLDDVTCTFAFALPLLPGGRRAALVR